MEARTKEVLNLLDEALSAGDQTSRELAAVLSALRGPDVDDSDCSELVNKVKTTCAIRGAAFPKTVEAMSKQNFFVTDPNSGRLEINRYRGWGMVRRESVVVSNDVIADSGDFDSGLNHFYQHVRMAAEVLGLKVESAV